MANCSALGCANCTGLCHWCGDGCFDFYTGCVVGTACPTPAPTPVESCARAAPEFVGFLAAPASAAAGVLVAGAVFLTCVYCCCGIACSVYGGGSRSGGGSSADSGGALQMSAISPGRRGSGSKSSGSSIANPLASGAADRRTARSAASKQQSYAALEDEPGSSTGGGSGSAAERRRRRRPRRCFGVLACLTVLFSALSIAFYPEYPAYATCAQEFQWASILSQLYNMGLRGDEKLLVSIYNPNRLGFMLTAASAVFKSRGAAVGTFSFDGEYELAAGAVTDVMATVRFEPSLLQAYHLYWDFELSKLTFDIDASFAGDVMLGRARLYALSQDVAEHTVTVGDDGGRELCKCQSWGAAAGGGGGGGGSAAGRARRALRRRLLPAVSAKDGAAGNASMRSDSRWRGTGAILGSRRDTPRLRATLGGLLSP
jgi:hypothetical protein